MHALDCLQGFNLRRRWIQRWVCCGTGSLRGGVNCPTIGVISDAEVRTPSHSHPHIAISALHVHVLLCVGDTGVQVHEVCVESWMRQFQRLAAAHVNDQFPPLLFLGCLSFVTITC